MLIDSEEKSYSESVAPLEAAAAGSFSTLSFKIPLHYRTIAEGRRRADSKAYSVAREPETDLFLEEIKQKLGAVLTVA